MEPSLKDLCALSLGGVLRRAHQLSFIARGSAKVLVSKTQIATVHAFLGLAISGTWQKHLFKKGYFQASERRY